MPEQGLVVSFTCKADARAALSAMSVGTDSENGPRLVVLRGVSNDSLELEIKFLGGAVFDPSSWSRVESS